MRCKWFYAEIDLASIIFVGFLHMKLIRLTWFCGGTNTKLLKSITFGKMKRQMIVTVQIDDCEKYHYLASSLTRDQKRKKTNHVWWLLVTEKKTLSPSIFCKMDSSNSQSADWNYGFVLLGLWTLANWPHFYLDWCRGWASSMDKYFRWKIHPGMCFCVDWPPLQPDK